MFKIACRSPALASSLTYKPLRFLYTSKSVQLKNYYEILQVSRNSSPAEVKKAYYQLAKRHHPDRNPNDPKAETVFQNIAEAYEVLSDDKKRLEYDNIDSPIYESSVSVNEDLKGKKQRKVWTYNLENDPLELFKEVFGDLKSNFSKTAAEDSTSFVQDRLRIPHSVVTISLKEAAEGTTRGVKFNSSSLKTLDNQEVLVIIPPGIEDGQTLRLKINGDTEALVQVKVEALDHFQRQGCHIFSEEWVHLWDAALGNIVTFKGLHTDQVQVQLPAGLKSHSVLKLPNLGFKRFDHPGQFGDHFVTIKIRSVNKQD